MGKNTAARTRKQITGDRGEAIAKIAFPHTWVVRDLPSDYGLDLNIEVFNTPAGNEDLLTTGQHLYAQVKSTANGLKATMVDGRRLLSPSVPMKTINTVTAMGPAVPVLLLYVDVVAKSVYWVCLNDYIDKILRPENPQFQTRDSVTILIDPENVLDISNNRFWMVEALSQRAKLYAAFSLFSHMETLAKARIQKWGVVDDIKLPQGTDPENLGRDPEMQHLAALLEQAWAMDIWSPTAVGSMRWDRLIGLKAVLLTLKKAISGLANGVIDPNAPFAAAVGTYRDRALSEFFTSDAGITPLSPFFTNLEQGFKILASASAGFEGVPRWNGLHIPAPENP